MFIFSNANTTLHRFHKKRLYETWGHIEKEMDGVIFSDVPKHETTAEMHENSTSTKLSELCDDPLEYQVQFVIDVQDLMRIIYVMCIESKAGKRKKEDKV